MDLSRALRSDLPSSLFRLCAMCDLGAHPSPALLPGIVQPTTSRRLQPLMVCRTLALALSVRPGLFSRWGTLSSPLAVHAAFSFLSARCVFSSQLNCFVCAWCWPRVAWVRGVCVWILRWPFVVTPPSSLFRLCAMCDLGACPPSRCCRASCNPQHPDDSSGCAYVAPWLWHCPFALRCFRVGARCPRPSPSMPSSLSSPRVVCSVASTTALSALGAGPAWLGLGGGNMWILRRPFVVT